MALGCGLAPTNQLSCELNRPDMRTIERMIGRPFTFDAASSQGVPLCRSSTSNLAQFTGARVEGHALWIDAPLSQTEAYVRGYLACKEKSPANTVCPCASRLHTSNQTATTKRTSLKGLCMHNWSAPSVVGPTSSTTPATPRCVLQAGRSADTSIPCSCGHHPLDHPPRHWRFARIRKCRPRSQERERERETTP